MVCVYTSEWRIQCSRVFRVWVNWHNRSRTGRIDPLLHMHHKQLLSAGWGYRWAPEPRVSSVLQLCWYPAQQGTVFTSGYYYNSYCTCTDDIGHLSLQELTLLLKASWQTKMAAIYLNSHSTHIRYYVHIVLHLYHCEALQCVYCIHIGKVHVLWKDEGPETSEGFGCSTV